MEAGLRTDGGNEILSKAFFSTPTFTFLAPDALSETGLRSSTITTFSASDLSASDPVPASLRILIFIARADAMETDRNCLSVKLRSFAKKHTKW
jgi:hypothetical protein